MTEAEWLKSADAIEMIETLWRIGRGDVSILRRQLHRYYLACCREIWSLLPQEASRHGVIVAERRLSGGVSNEEFFAANREAEGAAFRIDYSNDPEGADRVETLELLKRAAYFVDYAMVSQGCPEGPPPDTYAPFLSADLLREVFGNPFRPDTADRV